MDLTEDENVERMSSGQLYIPGKARLDELRTTARLWCREFNATDDSVTGVCPQREELMKGFFGACGEGAVIEPPFRCEYGFNVFIGDGFYANYDLAILDCCPVRIGNNVLLGPGVHLYTAEHPRSVAGRATCVEFGAPITIGDDVWIGGRVVVLPGVTIGSGCIIGGGSVVTKDIPPHTIAAGNPCRPIKAAPMEPTDEEKEFFKKYGIPYDSRSPCVH
ncbi:Maltose O-acetyltransferase, putative [Perkinsus marinus ATCC 50983]|uniref:Maltose O-acetyltransferase, putative n=1 Tax=Perkinsus marinus (strain ATCC 50983 / TXsc) TaxID=423536 RepID=C5LWX7_PERM5|nr:Maltose O-acetyltransferase, putative [Perkinsus marinus ATCC 50983]EEQ98755.1 Maltose O-acetyltransferase, putative [Perkinsus marinus ATCC 50983]|eukprot:XP_002766038.1 Maltose O-acetyltransferase, putative [Perkinsus marinus ATCC 50983]